MPQSREKNANTSLEQLEREKYERTWAVDSYSKTSPAFHRFFDKIKAFIDDGDRVIYFGCGSGLILDELSKSHDVLGVDIAENCLMVDVPFKQACLWNPIDVSGDSGVCVDVMEHIPTEKVPDVFREIMACVDRCFFMACMLPDSNTTKKRFGHDTLHMTVRDSAWWFSEAEKHGTVTLKESDNRSAIFVIKRV